MFLLGWGRRVLWFSGGWMGKGCACNHHHVLPTKLVGIEMNSHVKKGERLIPFIALIAKLSF